MTMVSEKYQWEEVRLFQVLGAQHTLCLGILLMETVLLTTSLSGTYVSFDIILSLRLRD